MRCKLRISYFNGYGEDGIHRDTHGQRIHVAVVDGATPWCDFNGALLLPRRARQVVAVTEELQVAQPAEDRSETYENYCGNHEQPLVGCELMSAGHRLAVSLHDVRAIVGHDGFGSASAPPRASLSV